MKKSKIILLLILVLLTGCKMHKKKNGLQIVVTSFPCYDFARAVTNNPDNITMLIKPGSEVHTYDPTPQDIMTINEADVFIYIGGESDEWVINVLNSVDNKDLKVIRLFDYVSLLKEDGEDEEDEHIWTSPDNMIKCIEAIYNVIIKIDNKNKDKYKVNKDNYITKINNIDNKYQEMLKDTKRNVLVFADRFPLKYFANYYNIDYIAAFNGCSAEAEINPKKLTKIINTIKNKDVPIIFYLEFSNQKIADTIKKEAKVESELFESGQNITSNDFKNGVTLVDMMENNLSKVERALR